MDTKRGSVTFDLVHPSIDHLFFLCTSVCTEQENLYSQTLLRDLKEYIFSWYLQA